ncbi:Uncharacterized protein PRO82_000467 [Candidatus Protochlamydia amoebophila]|uniref:hypothetical protein n=1 Tax=Candidatus Protochlamydia amoebophila TaxID=362787 RepID=UPI001BC97FB1|nr:hypothetical protein [Candidatus Protochlamydia amoebophila]MBS4163169.1 Uncharacterized protein [Candidatus Protochlamydia amoebophila]
MSNLFVTLVIAFVVIVIAIACLAIGWLITGKTKIERGACGRDPHQKREDTCGSVLSCDLCSNSLEQNIFETKENLQETSDELNNPLSKQ